MPIEAVRFPFRNELVMPVIGMEAEFKIFVDDEPIVPEEYWRSPAAFIHRPMLQRGRASSQLPTGGAVYFDGGVLEVVTPVIEIAPQCTARVVRSLWEQIGFVRHQLDAWERHNDTRVRMQAFSCHFNISYEIPRHERGRDRTIQKLAFLLAHLLPMPTILVGLNRRSSGVGVRPRRDRIEITLDFTPDPALMAATTALIVGIVRDVITWPSYRVDELERRGIPLLRDIGPGKHPTRNGWVVRDFHFPQNPFLTPPDAQVWTTIAGRTMSTRQVAREIALVFAPSIARLADPFSERILFGVLEGEIPSLLDLDYRPAAYDDIGRAIRWGATLPDLRNFESLLHPTERRRRRADVETLSPPWRGHGIDRRARVALPPRIERRQGRERRTRTVSEISTRLSRSQYEKVFRQLTSGKRLRVGREVLTPVGVRGWYHAIFRTAGGEERVLSIDQVLAEMHGWRE